VGYRQMFGGRSVNMREEQIYIKNIIIELGGGRGCRLSTGGSLPPLGGWCKIITAYDVTQGRCHDFESGGSMHWKVGGSTQ